MLSDEKFAEGGQCEVMNLFGVIIQICLACICFCVLILKRYKEKPQRPWKVWGFDVSKQIASAGTQHCTNILLSLIFGSGEKEAADECIWYFLNFLLDVTIGIVICIWFMKLANFFIEKYHLKYLKSGFYFEKIKLKDKIYFKLQWKMYVGQLGLWLGIILVTKILMFCINHLLNSVFTAIGKWILSPVENYPKLKLIIVMVIVPIICDVLQFWIFDNLLKFKFNNDSSNILVEALNSSEELRAVVEKENADLNSSIVEDSLDSDVGLVNESVDSKEKSTIDDNSENKKVNLAEDEETKGGDSVKNDETEK